MPECIIAFRYHNGKVAVIINGDEGNPAVFPDRDAAIKFVQESEFLNSTVSQVVELDEL